MGDINETNAVVGICIPKSAIFAVIATSVLKNGNAFTWINPDSDLNFIRYKCIKLKVRVLVIDTKSNIKVEPSEVLKAGRLLKMVKLLFSDNLDVYGTRFVYATETSGSTGEPKTVFVPEESVYSNVDYFMSLFHLTCSSRLIWSTALSFDPSLLELLLWYKAGCHLYVLTDNQRTNIQMTKKLLIKAKPDFYQVTPAVLNLFDADFLNELLSSTKIVKNLLVGGDTFPVRLIKRYFKCGGPKIYNVYGVTEMSVWASCTEFDPLRDNLADASNSLPDTEVIFVKEKGVIIKSDRRFCFVNNEKCNVIVTDDQFQSFEENGVTKYNIIGRKKIRGQAISRDVEDYVIKTYDYIKDARMVIFNDFIYLFVVTTDGKKIGIIAGYSIKKVFYIQQLPLNNNGKVDDLKLEELIRNGIVNEESVISRYLRENYIEDKSIPFWTLGFSSNDIFELVNELSLKFRMDYHKIKETLFNPGTTLKDVCTLIKGIEEDEMTLNLKWELKMEKCVDATPVIHNEHIVAVDMAGLVTCSTLDGEKKWEVKEEAAIKILPLVTDDIVVYGTTSGLLHVRRLCGDLLFKVELESQISSTPVELDDRSILITCFTNRIYQLDIPSKNLNTFLELDEGSKIRNPPPFDDACLIVATISGDVLAYSSPDLTLKWMQKLDEQILLPLHVFSRKILAFSVAGRIFVLQIESGNILQSLSLKTPFFLSPCLLSSNLFIAGGSDVIHRIDLSDDKLKVSSTTIGGIKLISGLTFCENTGKILVKSSMDRMCSILSFDPQNNAAKILARLQYPSFGDIAIKNGMIILGNRLNSIQCFALS
ncbi:unnamed protein product [Bursaphelenchus xylophilus]|uniref:(pine wood nematode) hypothetical protein n=1 Tax=Bursaphelenchus xylophilus TaxID=6326 RepID=A0A7I8WU95_BURXY|nr:unnamed protein product [Bursaphelenchus xylophilus]CAG9116532.1 unnamed protein product [Bursaphelenchus xylophilus]